jgi:phosphoribosyl-dephospho-CoA transferase
MGRVVKPHDLLRITADAAAFRDAPDWVAGALVRAPCVVVRRAPRLDGAIAVGLRGRERRERFGTWLDERHIVKAISPEELHEVTPAAERANLPAFALLRAVAPLCRDTGFAWGPTGSAGFELATGVATVTSTSDLDLLIRVPLPFGRQQAEDFHNALSSAASAAGTRIDVQIETHDAAFSLAEFARPGPGLRVMLRFAEGPRLAADPWQNGNVA